MKTSLAEDRDADTDVAGEHCVLEEQVEDPLNNHGGGGTVLELVHFG